MAEPVQQIGIREFRDRATQYLAGAQPIAITRHGRVIGFYIPVPPDREETDRALQRLAETVERVRRETGMSEDELANLFDLRKPLPE
jgi:antitoxin (DNA-binding transcriptional repressor) of toxin-antitoxin stability system